MMLLHQLFLLTLHHFIAYFKIYMNEIPHIKLPKTGEIVNFSSCFYHATDGQKATFDTNFSLTYTPKALRVDFQCFDNNYTYQNAMKNHNDPLYDQEVFEVFIAAGSNDPDSYLEIELNPNNASWYGRMSNPSLGLENVIIDKMLSEAETGITHDVSVYKTTWSGFIEIPWNAVGEKIENNYRINFYRIRSNTSHPNITWQCNPASCDFVCFSSTLSGIEPAFHRPRRFAFLELV